ncbi:MAG: hypothetical protein GY906_07605 [bacterium]|nr:hypothetical protein [bacterium]
MRSFLVHSMTLLLALWAGTAWCQGLNQVSARDVKIDVSESASNHLSMLLNGGREGVELVSTKMVWQPMQMPAPPAAAGDGVWVEILSARLELLARVPAGLPAKGETCFIKVPVPRGTWWALIVRRESDETEILARIQVGVQIAKELSEINTISQ